MSLISLISLQESGKYIIKQNDPNSEKKRQKQYIASHVETVTCNICLCISVYIYIKVVLISAKLKD